MVGGLKEWGTEATDFLREIGLEASTRLLRDLRKLANERHQLRDISKPIGQGLFELTTTHKGMEYRCLYVFHDREIVVLVCFVKKERKLPSSKLDLARKRQSELLRLEVCLGDVGLH